MRSRSSRGRFRRVSGVELMVVRQWDGLEEDGW